MDFSLPQPLDQVVNFAMNGQSAEARALLESGLRPHPCAAARWFMVAKLLLVDEVATKQLIMQGLVQEASPEAITLVRLLDGMALAEHRREIDAMLARLEHIATRLEGTAPSPLPPPLAVATVAENEKAEVAQKIDEAVPAMPEFHMVASPPPPPIIENEEAEAAPAMPEFHMVASPPPPPIIENEEAEAAPAMPEFHMMASPPPLEPPIVENEEAEATPTYAACPATVEEFAPAEPPPPTVEQTLANLQLFWERLTTPVTEAACPATIAEFAPVEPPPPTVAQTLSQDTTIAEFAPAELPPPTVEQTLANLQLFLKRLTTPVIDATCPAAIAEFAPTEPPPPTVEQTLANLQLFLERLTTPAPVPKVDGQERAKQAISHLERFLERTILARMQQFLAQILASQAVVAITP